MLIDDPIMMATDPITAVIAKASKRSTEHKRLQQGVYEIGHFGSSNWPPGFEHYPEFGSFDEEPSKENDWEEGGIRSPYGVCDNIEQILKRYPELEDPNREFTITVHRLEKKDQEPRMGWRWYKWGPYIGTQDPQCEYLYDEPEIEKVYVFHIYEKKKTKTKDIGINGVCFIQKSFEE